MRHERGPIKQGSFPSPSEKHEPITKQPTWVATGAVVLTVLVGFIVGTGIVFTYLFVIAVLSVGTAYLLGRRLRTEHETWLPGLMALGMMVKLAGSTLRYFVLEVEYGGSGDAGRYHGFGLSIADVWRNLSVPDLATAGFGSEGTRFTAWVTGIIYTPYEPSMLGGFWLYAFLAFIGAVFFYLAFRTAVPDARWKTYAILVFFWPTLVYWPSSIGKEALIFPFLGLGAWAVAHLFRDYAVRWLPAIAIAAVMVRMVRVHVAAVFAVAIMLAVLLERRRDEAPPLHKRVALLVIGVVAAIPLAFGVADRFEVDLDDRVGVADLDQVFASVESDTQTGGSAVAGGLIRSPAEIPAGIFRVLFRPLPIEATNVQMLAASLEGTALLLLILWRIPSMVRNRRLIRRSPYVLFCLAYSFLFIWAWSAILNLGIVARQRSLVLPFIFTVVVALGVRSERSTDALSGTARIPHPQGSQIAIRET